MEETTNKKANSFITRDDFIDWVLSPTEASNRYWERFILENPSLKTDIEEACFIIRNILPKEKKIDNRKKDELWNSIYCEISKKARFRRYLIWSAVASVIAIIVFSLLTHFKENFAIGPEDIILTEKDMNTNDIKLIFSDQSVETFDTNELEIKYDENGKIEIVTEEGSKSDNKVNNVSDIKERVWERKLRVEKRKNPVNQVVVPPGKRTNLTLSDGTRLYLNSGSKAVFPVVFSTKKRELFIEGEAYIEVAHDPEKVFVVSAGEMNVKVLGTKFNISAYPEDGYCSVVLVEGKIEADINSQQVIVEPNYLLRYQKDSKETFLNKTDVMPHISWKDGWFYCENEELQVVAHKLARYYNIDIKFNDDTAPGLLLSGKLDLKKECSDIFETISSIAPISYEMTDNGISVSKKK